MSKHLKTPFVDHLTLLTNSNRPSNPTEPTRPFDLFSEKDTWPIRGFLCLQRGPSMRLTAAVRSGLLEGLTADPRQTPSYNVIGCGKSWAGDTVWSVGPKPTGLSRPALATGPVASAMHAPCSTLAVIQPAPSTQHHILSVQPLLCAIDSVLPSSQFSPRANGYTRVYCNVVHRLTRDDSPSVTRIHTR